jgi:hypothetical protein
MRALVAGRRQVLGRPGGVGDGERGKPARSSQVRRRVDQAGRSGRLSRSSGRGHAAGGRQVLLVEALPLGEAGVRLRKLPLLRLLSGCLQ